MNTPLKGFAYYIDVDGSIVKALADAGVFVVLADPVDETEQANLLRVRAGNAVRLSMGQIKNLLALPTGKSLTNLSATPLSSTAISLSWNRFPAATSYELQRSSDNITFDPFQKITATTIDNTGLTMNTLSYYRVRALNRLGTAISNWTPISATTLLGLEAVLGTTTTTAPGFITALGYNATLDFNVLNFLITATEPVEVQFSKNGEILTGTILAGNAGKFNLATDPWLTYGARIRLDRVVAGQGGVSPGDVITVIMRTVANRNVNFRYVWTPQGVQNTSAVSLPLTGTGTDTGNRLQIFAKVTFAVTVPDEEPDPVDTSGQPVYDMAQTQTRGVSWYQYSDTKAAMRNILLAAVEEGLINAVNLVIEWSELEPTPGQYNWAHLEDNYYWCLENGIKPFLLLAMNRKEELRLPFIVDEARMVDQYGRPSDRAGRGANFSLNHEGAVTAALSFVETVSERVNSIPALRNSLLGMSFSNTSQFELNYEIKGRIAPGSADERSVEYDRSTASVAKFRQRLAGWFPGGISTLNTYLNGTTYTNFNAVDPPGANAVRNEYSTKLDKLWYKHRHQTLKEFIERCCVRVRDVNNKWNLFPQFPHWDTGESAPGGTFGAGSLVPSWVNGVKLNPTPDALNKRVIDLILRDRLPARWGFCEVDGMDPRPGLEQMLIDQTKQLVDGGVSGIVMANVLTGGGTTIGSTIFNENKARFLNIMRQLNAHKPLLAAVAHPSVLRSNGSTREANLSLSIGIGSGWPHGVYVQDYFNIQNEGPVKLQVIDDLYPI